MHTYILELLERGFGSEKRVCYKISKLTKTKNTLDFLKFILFFFRYSYIFKFASI